MRRALTTFLLMTASAWGFGLSGPRTQALAEAVARAEGFYHRGSIPARYHNPGDIRSRFRHAYPRQVGLNKHGYVIFRTDADGWRALRAQIEKLLTNESKFYNLNMTLSQFAKKYATSGTWIRNVSKILAVTPDTNMWEILDVAPRLEPNWL